jgi:predicted homoserine dehydrogenase-like protein
MNLYALLRNRVADGEPIRIGVVGAGKFGTMFLAQARTTPGMHVVAVADLAESRARWALSEAGFEEKRSSARSVADAFASGTTHITEDAEVLISAEGIDVVVEATGSPSAGIRHALLSFGHGCHVIMVNVEANALAGPLLARRAREAGVVYSLAYGDQPALMCEMVDWARATGFEVVCAGKGTKYLPEYYASTPDTVWEHYGFTDEQVESGGSTRGCSTPSSTEPSPPSRWPPSPTPPDSPRPPRDWRFRPQGRTSWPRSAGPGRTVGASTT